MSRTRKRKSYECIAYLSVEAPLEKVDYLEDKQAKYIYEYVRNKEYKIVGTMRRHGFSRSDINRQWKQIANLIRQNKADGVVVANMRMITDSLPDAMFKVGQIEEAGGFVVTVDDGRLDFSIGGFEYET